MIHIMRCPPAEEMGQSSYTTQKCSDPTFIMWTILVTTRLRLQKWMVMFP